MGSEPRNCIRKLQWNMNLRCPMTAILNFTIYGNIVSFTAWHTAEMDSAQKSHKNDKWSIFFLKMPICLSVALYFYIFPDCNRNTLLWHHCVDVIMGTIASQITSLTIVYSIVYSDADQRRHQSSASLTFVRGIHRGPVNSLHKWPVTQKMFPFDDVIMF